MRSRDTVTGLDVSYEEGTSRAVAAAVTLELATLKVVEAALYVFRAWAGAWGVERPGDGRG